MVGSICEQLDSHRTASEPRCDNRGRAKVGKRIEHNFSRRRIAVDDGRHQRLGEVNILGLLGGPLAPQPAERESQPLPHNRLLSQTLFTKSGWHRNLSGWPLSALFVHGLTRESKAPDMRLLVTTGILASA